MPIRTLAKIVLLFRYQPHPWSWIAARVLVAVQKLLRVGPKTKAKVIEIRTPKADLRLKSFVSVDNLDVSAIDVKTMSYLIEKYRSHAFDLLGSGWCVNRGFSARQQEINPHEKWPLSCVHPMHRAFSGELANRIDSGYISLDWQLDVKSGYRWSATKPSADCMPLFDQGVDIKVPWELARLQHLPQMALGAMRMTQVRVDLIREFKNQVYDFIAANPPGMGVQWTCTMDVAIRAANLILSNDLFRQLDCEGILDNMFERILAQSILNHAEHVASHLERMEIRLNNHYLANLTGLLLMTIYLEGDSRLLAWKEFAIKEFLYQVSDQFNDDGSTIEFSMSYHRLSGEMVIYATALMLRESQFETATLADRIRRLLDFTRTCMKPSGQAPQIGDNDSGRFFKLTPVGRWTSQNEWEEDFLDHRPLISAGEALFTDVQRSSFPEFQLEFSLIRNLCGPVRLKASGDQIQWDVQVCAKPRQKFERTFEVVAPAGDDAITEDLVPSVFPDFGLIVFRSPRLYLSICSGPLRGIKFGGHAHDDFASFECSIDGDNFARDPGTYTYTSNIALRNAFRSRDAHNGLWSPDMPDRWWRIGRAGLFEFVDLSRYSITEWSPCRVEVTRSFRRVVLSRLFYFLPDRIRITDRSNRPITPLRDFPYYSPAYGRSWPNPAKMEFAAQ